MRDEAIDAEFWLLVDVRDVRACWEWLGTTQNGYGWFRGEGAHRFAWSFGYGEIPDGLFVLHACDNRACVNPRHLRVGTHEDNCLDRAVHPRVVALRAKAGAEVRLDRALPADPEPQPAIGLRSIRKRSGMSQKDFARIVGVSQATACGWETGVHGISMKRATIVAGVLGVRVEELFVA